ncbi:MAG: 30S ribosomal protein S20 [Patescibacteria group bacterium]
MPITKSAKKALRGSAKKHVFNVRRKKKLDDAVKEVKKVATKAEKAAAMKSLSLAYKAIDKAAKGGLIKKGTADRKKSRLAAMVRKATA